MPCEKHNEDVCFPCHDESLIKDALRLVVEAAEKAKAYHQCCVVECTSHGYTIDADEFISSLKKALEAYDL